MQVALSSSIRLSHTAKLPYHEEGKLCGKYQGQYQRGQAVASEALAKAAAKSAEAQTSLWLLPSVEMEQQQSTLFCSWVVEMQLKQESHGFERF